ncbi:MAG: hypothetical protein KBS52_05695 [Clostridiales bacterium]|nr:hypothetical protein [Candidatus Equinaster intestinalis]
MVHRLEFKKIKKYKKEKKAMKKDEKKINTTEKDVKAEKQGALLTDEQLKQVSGGCTVKPK